MNVTKPKLLEKFTYKGVRCVILQGPCSINGYVGIGKDSELYGESYFYNRVDQLNVHGGITWAEHDLPNLSATTLDAPNLWWLGFDTNHASDDPQWGGYIKDLAYVRAETIKLAEQVAA